MSTATRRIRRRHDPAKVRAAQAAKLVVRTSADDLHAKLVDDACTGHPTDLQFAVLAYAKIAKARRIPLDQAFTDVQQEVVVRRGGLGMPLG